MDSICAATGKLNQTFSINMCRLFISRHDSFDLGSNSDSDIEPVDPCPHCAAQGVTTDIKAQHRIQDELAVASNFTSSSGQSGFRLPIFQHRFCSRLASCKEDNFVESQRSRSIPDAFRLGYAWGYFSEMPGVLQRTPRG